ncbi:MULTISPECIES: ligand-binding sensor domain-containing protein [Sphingobacterium]|uniref:histidine kinase n=1 Tax=Sphingobacterium populi TaxID=1812824 RepID=A0ABW5U8Q2_9SPHI|nr:sensor histidine kinase [Sphingobacterium sp. CFCC 11742]
MSVRLWLRIALCWLFLSTSSAFAQLYFNNFQVANGLSNNAVLCSAQDQDSFLWFGTRHGLNRFDGYNFKTYYADPTSQSGLGSNFIHSLCVADNKEIWVGTDQGLYIFDPYRQTFSLLTETLTKEIVQIQKDRTGDMWFVANNELFHYDIKERKLTCKVSYTQDHVAHFCIDRDNKIWYGTGTSIISLATKDRYTLKVHPNWNNRIEKLYVDEQNDIWIGTSSNGVYKLSGSSQQVSHVIPNIQANTPLFVRDIIEVDQNQLWIATEMGLLLYNKKDGTYSIQRHEKDNPWSLSDNALYTIIKDHQQGIWIGTFFGGLNYYHQQHNFFEKIFPRYSRNSIQGHATREIIEDQYYNIWIGTEDEGLTCWNPKSNTFETLDPNSGLSHSNVHGLALVGDSLLVGTFYKGMDVVDVRSKRVLKSFNIASTQGALGDDFVYSIYKTRDSSVLLATSKGLYQFFAGADRFSYVQHAPKHVFYTSIFEDKKENIWLTTWRNGVIKLNRSKGTLERYWHDPKDKNSINSNRANRVFQDHTGQIWIGTESGIALWNENNNNFERITTRNGLPSNMILGFEQDVMHNIWISTSQGLVKMEYNKKAVETFDTELGILDLQFNYNSAFKDSQGYLYFGSTKGLIRFNPQVLSSLYRTNMVTPIYITGIQSHQRELTIGGAPGDLTRSITYADAITLEHDESTISIDFAALNYVSAQSTSYRYRLLGLDSAWTFLRKNNKANFTKIPPGRYTFQVLACDANGLPISKEKHLQIIIRPPLWASLPAFVFYGIFILAAISLAIYFYDRHVREKNRRRLQTIKSHKERELYRAKMDFFMRVTHEIKTPLTLIKAPLEKIHTLPHDEKTSKWLNTIQINTDRLISLTEQLLDFRKVESDEVSLHLQLQNIAPLVRLCVTEFDPIIENRSLQVSLRLQEAVEAYIDVEVIYKIISNLLSNAVKYADSIVIITLSEDADSDTFSCVIKNDGIKLQAADVVEIFKPFHRSSVHYQVSGSGLGLALAYSFTNLHSGELFYDNGDSSLNTFVLRIPKDARTSVINSNS